MMRRTISLVHEKIRFSTIVCGFLACAILNATVYEASMAAQYLFSNNPLLPTRRLLTPTTFALKKSIVLSFKSGP